MNKYTSGPWRVDNNHGSLWVESDCENLVVQVAKGIGSELDHANARLIAATPDLLASLEEVLAYCKEHGHDWMCMAQARATIMKATGEQQ